MKASALRGVIALLGFVAVVVGAQAAWLAWHDREPREIPLAEFQERRPDSKWLKLTGCELDLLDARYFNYVESDHAAEFLIPLRPADADTNAPIHALAALHDEKLRVRVDAIALADITRTLDAFTATNAEPLAIPRDIEGVTRFGWDSVAENRRELLALHPRLVEDFVIVDVGDRPSWFLATLLPVGVGFLLWVAVTGRKGMKRPGAEGEGSRADSNAR